MNLSNYFIFSDEDGLCVGILTNSTGTVESPDRDGDEENDIDLNCVWAIIAPNRYRIEIEVTQIDIQPGSFAFVQVSPSL